MKIKERTQRFIAGFLDAVVDGTLDKDVKTPFDTQKRVETASYASMAKAAIGAPHEESGDGDPHDGLR